MNIFIDDMKVPFLTTFVNLGETIEVDKFYTTEDGLTAGSSHISFTASTSNAYTDEATGYSSTQYAAFSRLQNKTLLNETHFVPNITESTANATDDSSTAANNDTTNTTTSTSTDTSTTVENTTTTTEAEVTGMQVPEPSFDFVTSNNSWWKKQNNHHSNSTGAFLSYG